MSNQDSPTPPAPAEVSERLKKARAWLAVESSKYNYPNAAGVHEDTLTAALLLIEQGEKEWHYIVTAYRYGQRNAHSYVVGAFTNLEAAKKCATEHVDYRGGKYGCEVIEAGVWDEASDQAAKQVFYVESPYVGVLGDAGHFHAADKNGKCYGARKPFTVRELQNLLWWAERNAEQNAKRLHWLHDRSTGVTDAEGFEWGIYRVKWVNGKAAEVLATLSDFSDLDREMAREKAARAQPTPESK